MKSPSHCGAIDDATGAILGLHFSENECLHGYFQVISFSEYGRPLIVL